MSLELLNKRKEADLAPQAKLVRLQKKLTDLNMDKCEDVTESMVYLFNQLFYQSFNHFKANEKYSVAVNPSV